MRETHKRFKRLNLDLNDGQFLIAMRCRCIFYTNDAMSMFLAISYHRNQCDYFCSTIGTGCFPIVFQISEPMFGDDFLWETLEQRILRHTQICDKLCVLMGTTWETTKCIIMPQGEFRNFMGWVNYPQQHQTYLDACFKASLRRSLPGANILLGFVINHRLHFNLQCTCYSCHCVMPWL